MSAPFQSQKKSPPTRRSIIGGTAAIAAALFARRARAGYVPLVAQMVNIPNIAALRAQAGPIAAVMVQGYYVAADGGGGAFIVNPADTTSADNGGTIIVDAVGRRWYRSAASSALSVVWFGAYMNSSTDSTAAWNACLAALPANGGKIYAPGSYTFAGLVSYTFTNAFAALTIEGDGSEASRLTWPAGQGMIVNFINGFNSVHVRDLCFAIGIAGTSSQPALTLNMTVTNANAANSALSDITGCTFRGSDAYLGTNYWANGVVCVGVSNVNFLNCNFAGAGIVAGNGIFVYGNSSTPAVIYDVTSCNFSGLNIGFLYGSYDQGLQVTACNFTACNYGVSAGSGELVLDQIAVSNCQFACVHAGIGLFSAVSNVAVSNNLFIIGSAAYGVYMTSANVYGISNNSFVPNTVHVNCTGVAIVANTIPGTIEGNTFASLTLGVQFGTSTTGNRLDLNVYDACTTNYADAGSGNLVGVISP